MRAWIWCTACKVLAHVPPIREALVELARVTRPGGQLHEFYNPRSLRYLAKLLGGAAPIADGTTDRDVFNRYDTLATARGTCRRRSNTSACRRAGGDANLRRFQAAWAGESLRASRTHRLRPAARAQFRRVSHRRRTQKDAMTTHAGDILIVDDERSMREFLGIYLRREGYRIEAAPGGNEPLPPSKRAPST